MIDPSLRPLAADDLDVISRIHREAAQIAYAYRGWGYSMAECRVWYAGKQPEWDWGRVAWAADPAGEKVPVGFIAAIGSFVDQLFVLPAHQRAGTGRRLLTAMLTRGLRPVQLHVLEGNAPARAFYERQGFLQERAWWDESEHETVMLYRLD